MNAGQIVPFLRSVALSGERLSEADFTEITEALARRPALDVERLVDIIEQAIFETGTGLEAALLASERIAREYANVDFVQRLRAEARRPALDVALLARALCWERGPDGGFDVTTIHVDDECRGMASRLAAEYARLTAEAER